MLCTREQRGDDAESTEHQEQSNVPSTLSQLHKRNANGRFSEPHEAHHYQVEVAHAPKQEHGGAHQEVVALYWVHGGSAHWESGRRASTIVKSAPCRVNDVFVALADAAPSHTAFPPSPNGQT